MPKNKTVEKPGLPKLSELGQDLLRVSRFQVFRAISIPFVMFASYWLFAANGYWVLAFLSLVVLSFVTYGSTSHDLVHSSLGLSRRTNDFWLAVIEAISLRSGHAYQAAHLNHHARYPHEDDVEAYAACRSWQRALLDGFVMQFRVYAWALGNPRAKRKWVVGEGIAVLMFVLAAVAAVPYTIVPLAYVGIMVAGTWVIPLATSYAPHDPAAKDELHQTRLFRGIVMRVIAVDHFYHLEHHLYPAVPHQNWPQLAKRLDPWFDEAGIEAVRLGV